jgi:3-dehydroquinate dehydratase II
MKKILIINGPNLNMLGSRQPEIYGNQSFDEYLLTLRKQFPATTIDYFQSNTEGEIVTRLQECFQSDYTGIVINAAAYTHTSIAIADATALLDVPVVEVHISNVYAREPFRKHSYLSAYCTGVMAGFGLKGYEMAIYFLTAKT